MIQDNCSKILDPKKVKISPKVKKNYSHKIKYLKKEGKSSWIEKVLKMFLINNLPTTMRSHSKTIILKKVHPKNQNQKIEILKKIKEWKNSMKKISEGIRNGGKVELIQNKRSYPTQTRGKGRGVRINQSRVRVFGWIQVKKHNNRGAVWFKKIMSKKIKLQDKANSKKHPYTKNQKI